LSSMLLRRTAAWLLPMLAAGAAQAQCAAKPAVLLERFVSAACTECWKAAPPQPATGLRSSNTLAIDWVVPDAGAGTSPLSRLANAEGSARAARNGGLRADEALTRSHPIPSRSAMRLKVSSASAADSADAALRMNVRFESAQRAPRQLEGYLALVEHLPAGELGSPIERTVLRSVAGPLAISDLSAAQPADLEVSMHRPETQHPERLSAFGWVETTKGHVLAVAMAAGPSCPAD
jgi:hypothetical protein